MLANGKVAAPPADNRGEVLDDHLDVQGARAPRECPNSVLEPLDGGLLGTEERAAPAVLRLHPKEGKPEKIEGRIMHVDDPGFVGVQRQAEVREDRVRCGQRP